MNDLINGVDIAYEIEGEGPDVLLIHGFPLCGAMWEPQRKVLVEQGYRVVIPDLRGMGRSGRGQSPVSMDDYADDQIALMDSLGIECAIVGGMSMGGYVLLNMLERYSERIRAAGFFLTRAAGDDETGRIRRKAMAQQALGGGSRIISDSFASLVFAESTLLDRPSLVATVRKWMLQASPEGLADALMAMRDRRDYSRSLDAITAPSLVIGADQDRAVPMDEILLFEKGLCENRTCIIADAGHMANLEQPEIFNDCLMGFLGELRASSF